MHYCVHLFTEKIPTDADIDRIMHPYNDDVVYADRYVDEECEVENKNWKIPLFSWDYWEIGGRYHGKIKLKIDENDKEYRWRFYEFDNPREGRLFLSSAIRKMKNDKSKGLFNEEDWFNFFGYDEGYLKVDGAKIKDIMNIDELGCFIFIDKNGKAFARSTWNGEGFDDDEHFDEEYKATIEANKDCFLTILDIHD
jgi:hypothetical protein